MEVTEERILRTMRRVSGSFTRSCKLSTSSTTACIGWRRSWLAAARKWVFAALARSSSSFCRVRSWRSSRFS